MNWIELNRNIHRQRWYTVIKAQRQIECPETNKSRLSDAKPKMLSKCNWHLWNSNCKLILIIQYIWNGWTVNIARRRFQEHTSIVSFKISTYQMRKKDMLILLIIIYKVKCDRKSYDYCPHTNTIQYTSISILGSKIKNKILVQFFNNHNTKKLAFSGSYKE